MMKNLIVILLMLFTFSTIDGQVLKDIYKNEGKVESPDFGNYNINVLFLYDDGTYKILWQKYSNKKMARKNILLDLIEEYGNWSKSDNCIELHPDDKNQKMKFKMKNENKLLFIMEDGNTGSIWCKIKR